MRKATLKEGKAAARERRLALVKAVPPEGELPPDFAYMRVEERYSFRGPAWDWFACTENLFAREKEKNREARILARIEQN